MSKPQSERQLTATVRAVAGRAAQRAMVAAAWRGASVAVAAGGVASLAWVALSRVWEIGAPVEWMLWAPAGAGVAVAVGVAVWGRWSTERAAREVDARLRLRDALSSALSLSERKLSGVEHELARLAIADADALASRVNLVAAVPMPTARQWTGWLAAGAMAMLAAWGVSERWPSATASRVVVATKEETKSAQSVVADAKATLQQVAAQSESAASGALDGRAADAMSQVERELAAGTMTPREAAVTAAEELQASADQLEQEAEEQERSSEDVQDALRALRERAIKAGAAPKQSDLAKAIADGDAARAADEIAKLQDRLADLPADERERVAKELESLAEQTKEGARGGSGESPSENVGADEKGELADAMKQAADEIRSGASDAKANDGDAAKREQDQGAPNQVKPEDKAPEEREPKQSEKSAPDAGGTPPPKAQESQPSGDAGATPKTEGQAPPTNKPVESATDKTGKQEQPQSPVTPPGIEAPTPQPATGEKQQSGEQGKAQQGDGKQGEGKQGEGKQGEGKPGQQGQGKAGQGQKGEGAKEQSGAGQSEKGAAQSQPKQAQPKQGESETGSKEPVKQGTEKQGQGKPEQGKPEQGKQEQGKQENGQQGAGEGGGKSEQTSKPGPDGGEAGKDSSTARKPDENKSTAPRPGGKEGAGAKEKGEQSGGGEQGAGKSSGGTGQSDQQKTPGMEELRRAMKSASEGKKSGAQSREQAERLREQAKRALEQLKPEEREELQRLAQEMKKSPSSGSQGVVPNDNPGDAPGMQPGALPGGGGQGAPVAAAPGDEDVVRVRGGDDGASKRTLAEWLAKPTKGEARGDATLSGALQEAAAGAERAVEQQAVPSRHADYLKRVYKRYRERAAQTPPAEKK